MNARIMTRAALALALVAALLVVSLAGRLAGVGAEAAPTAHGTTDFELSGTASGAMAPGLAPAPIDLAVTNPNTRPLNVTHLGVTVTRTSRPGCAAADFTVRQYAGTYPLTVAGGAAGVRLTSLGVANDALPTIALLDGTKNLDACKGVTVHLAFTGTATNR